MIKRRNNIWSVLISKTGTKVSSAKVTIDGVDYPVTPARYTGATPLSSVVMNAMQTNIENAINQNVDNIGGEEYDNTATYEEGDIVKYQGQLYICIEAIETAEDWDSTKWSETDVLSSAGGNEVTIGTSADITSKTKIFIDESEGTDTYSEVVNSLSGDEIAKAPSVRAVNGALGTINTSIDNIVENLEGMKFITKLSVSDTFKVKVNTTTFTLGYVFDADGDIFEFHINQVHTIFINTLVGSNTLTGTYNSTTNEATFTLSRTSLFFCIYA